MNKERSPQSEEKLARVKSKVSEALDDLLEISRMNAKFDTGLRQRSEDNNKSEIQRLSDCIKYVETKKLGDKDFRRIQKEFDSKHPDMQSMLDVIALGFAPSDEKVSSYRQLPSLSVSPSHTSNNTFSSTRGNASFVESNKSVSQKTDKSTSIVDKTANIHHRIHKESLQQFDWKIRFTEEGYKVVWLMLMENAYIESDVPGIIAALYKGSFIFVVPTCNVDHKSITGRIINEWFSVKTNNIKNFKLVPAIAVADGGRYVVSAKGNILPINGIS